MSLFKISVIFRWRL